MRRASPGQALRGDGTDEDVLERAGAREAEWFFALTHGDNRNILASELAKQVFGIPHVLCKINDPVRSKAYATLGIDTVNRTEMMLDSIGRHMGRPAVPGAGDVTVAIAPPAARATPVADAPLPAADVAVPAAGAAATPPDRTGDR